jgi:hypothetical protein
MSVLELEIKINQLLTKIFEKIPAYVFRTLFSFQYPVVVFHIKADVKFFQYLERIHLALIKKEGSFEQHIFGFIRATYGYAVTSKDLSTPKWTSQGDFFAKVVQVGLDAQTKGRIGLMFLFFEEKQIECRYYTFHVEIAPECLYCNKKKRKASIRCQTCSRSLYCSIKCQDNDRPEHDSICFQTRFMSKQYALTRDDLK